MKKIICIILSICLIFSLFTAMPVFAAVGGEYGTNCTWSFDTTNGVLTLSGTGKVYTLTEVPWLIYKDYIKKIVVNNGITTLGDNLFNSYTALEDVSLPSTLRALNNYTFSNCTSLKNINLPDSLNRLSIGTFKNCKALEQITFPDSLNEMRSYAFEGCTSLDNVSLPKNLKTISSYTFKGCTALKNISFPENLQTIGNNAFQGCTALEYVSFPENLQTIGNNAFRGCTALEYVSFPENLQTIEYWAFQGCTALKNASFPENLQTIGSSAFQGCTALEYVSFPENLQAIGSKAFDNCDSLTSVTLNNVNSFGTEAFNKCDNLETVIIKGNVQSTKSSWSHFPQCNSLKNVIIEEGVESVTQINFSDCTALENVSIPYSLKSDIGNYSNCDALTEITIPSGMIGFDAFADCDNLTKINIGKNVSVETEWTYPYHYTLETTFLNCNKLKEINVYEPNETFVSSDGVLYAENTVAYVPLAITGFVTVAPDVLDVRGFGGTKITGIQLPESLNSISKDAFKDCDLLTQIHIPKNVVSIADSAFYGCDSLESVTFDEGTKTIGNNAFFQCANLKEVKLPSTITQIGNYAFSECPSLQEIIIPGNSLRIGEYAFANDSSLNKVTAENGVSEILKYAFDGTAITNFHLPLSVAYIGKNALPASSMQYVYYEGTKEDWNKIIFEEAVNSSKVQYCKILGSGTCGDNLTWKVDNRDTLTITGTGEMYDYEARTAPWYSLRSKFSKIIFSNTITKIGNYAFYETARVKNISIPESVVSIGDYSFSRCTSLESFEIPRNLTAIGNCAFLRTDSLKEITADEKNTEYLCLDGVLFDKNKSKILLYPASKTSETYTVPDSISEITPYSFYGNVYLTELEIPNKLKTVGRYAFANCTALSTVVYKGAKSEFNEIVIGFSNAPFEEANIITSEIDKADYWSFDQATATLTITGNGYMPGFTSSSLPPWNDIMENIEYVNISEGILSVGTFTFKGAVNLKKVNIASTVESIGNYAFFNCASLEEVNMSGTTKIIGANAFNGCDSLANVNVQGTLSDYENTTVEKGNLPYERAKIVYTYDGGKVYVSMSIYARWYYDTTTKKLTVNNYPYIASRDMLNYKKATDVPWSNFLEEIESVEVNGVLSIGSRSFINGTSIKNAVADDSIEKINSWSFFNCSALENVELGANLTTVGTGAFNGATALKHVNINTTLEEYRKIVFGISNNPIIRTDTTLTDGVSGYMGGNVFWSLKDRILTLHGSGPMPSVSSADATPWSAYKSEILTLVIEDNITSISTNAFNNLMALDDVIIGEGVETIGSYAFKDLDIINVTLPSTLKKVGSSAFKSCSKLRNVLYNGTNAQFKKISISTGNTPLQDATKIYQ